ncbi:MAG TPA: hypothetical protein VEA79_00115 [Phenylobacterium sp.]|nr:hypothetical protein [Phenylobacterium sp.]
MKNITLAIDDSVLARVRRYAAARDTTVNAIVRDHLTHIAEESDRVAGARRRLLEMIDASQADLGPVNWTREDLYDRSR